MSSEIIVITFSVDQPIPNVGAVTITLNHDGLSPLEYTQGSTSGTWLNLPGDVLFTSFTYSTTGGGWDYGSFSRFSWYSTDGVTISSGVFGEVKFIKLTDIYDGLPTQSYLVETINDIYRPEGVYSTSISSVSGATISDTNTIFLESKIKVFDQSGEYPLPQRYVNSPQTTLQGGTILPQNGVLTGNVVYGKNVYLPSMTNTYIEFYRNWSPTSITFSGMSYSQGQKPTIGSTLLASTTTATNSGYFTVSISGWDLNEQITIFAYTPKPCGGFNATDALRASQDSGVVIVASSLDKRIMNVNLRPSGNPNATSALLITQRSVGSITTFAAGDWLINPLTFSLASIDQGSNLYSFTISCYCYGDSHIQGNGFWPDNNL